MKKNDAYMKELRSMSKAELEEQLTYCATQLFYLRSLMVSGQQVKSHFFRVYRKQIAKIQTVLNEKRAN